MGTLQLVPVSSKSTSRGKSSHAIKMVSYKQLFSGLLLLGLASAAPPASSPTTTVVEDYKVCIVEPCAGGDSSYAIEEAFAVCGHNEKGRAKVQFLNETYTIARVMNTTSLKNVDVDLQGTLSVRIPALVHLGALSD